MCLYRLTLPISKYLSSRRTAWGAVQIVRILCDSSHEVVGFPTKTQLRGGTDQQGDGPRLLESLHRSSVPRGSHMGTGQGASTQGHTWK